MRKTLYPLTNLYFVTAALSQDFRFVIRGNSYTVAIQGTAADFVIQWGDGTTSVAGPDLASRTHTYASSADWTITIKDYKSGAILFYGDTKLIHVLTPFPDMGITSANAWFSGCSNLATIPSGLFSNCSEITNFTHCFSNCTGLTSIPLGLFDNCRKAENFYSVFYSCASIASIPKGLFDYCTEVTDFQYSFYRCTNLTTIPSGLFDKCIKASTFYSCFGYCNVLSIPKGLFDYCSKVVNFQYCFYKCANLASIPEGLFDNCMAVTGFQYCFYDCVVVTGTAPPLWERTGVSGVSCFGRCTKLTNYDDIPAGWK